MHQATRIYVDGSNQSVDILNDSFPQEVLMWPRLFHYKQVLLLTFYEIICDNR